MKALIGVITAAVLFLILYSGSASAEEPPQDVMIYYVQAGDTLGEIASFFQVPLDDLIEYNNIKNPNLIEPGQQLFIRRPSTPYQVQFGDTLSALAARFNTTVEAFAAVNEIENPNLIYVGQLLIIPYGHMYYVIEHGDTLGEIAAFFRTTVEQLADLNNIANINLIEVNQALFLPLDSRIGTAFAPGCRVYSARVTAYSSSVDETDDTPFITYSGTYVHHGTVAAPWRFPIGTKVFIPGYGWGIVEDRGGLIDGRNFDVWMPSKQIALRWGVKYLNITIC